ncbi:Vgb family protein [Nocardia sp. CDC160]|uniref:Vgb family protein n=1 Tax=Nocardia sp. CDC160 TaxID=3112166 RepID=UPI002DBAD5C6|nr:hypothetical protein [Nocardia sp. CDC160]MEC3919360.1 hypothetical protein [Nocardia sp. CDC160]
MRLRSSAILLATTAMLIAAGPSTATPPPADLDAAVTQIPVGALRFAERFTPGPDGALWFTLPPSEVARLDTTTLEMRTFPTGGLLPGPTGITTGPDGAVWFFTLLGGYLGRIDPETYEITRVPLPHPLAGGHELVVGSDGALWYPEFVTNRAGRYDPRTGDQREFDLPFTFPTENPIMAAGPDGALWITAPAPPSRIIKLTPQGEVSEMTVPLQSIPFGLTNGPDGTIWATLGAGDYGRGQIISIDPTTLHIVRKFEIGFADGPSGLTTGPDCALWFPEIVTGKVGRLDPSTGDFTEYPIRALGGQAPFTVGSFPAYINTGPDGALWITSHLFGWIFRITPPTGATPGRTCPTVHHP